MCCAGVRVQIGTDVDVGVGIDIHTYMSIDPHVYEAGVVGVHNFIPHLVDASFVPASHGSFQYTLVSAGV
jgi:hypothetical protein